MSPVSSRSALEAMPRHDVASANRFTVPGGQGVHCKRIANIGASEERRPVDVGTDRIEHSKVEMPAGMGATSIDQGDKLASEPRVDLARVLEVIAPELKQLRFHPALEGEGGKASLEPLARHVP
jgi:hypothetical protein